MIKLLPIKNQNKIKQTEQNPKSRNKRNVLFDKGYI